MVGVPGRSKACHTCRKRRKACDQKKPSCGQCTLSRIPCGGYVQRLIFVNTDQQHRDATNRTYHPEAAAYSVESSSSVTSSIACVHGFQTCGSAQHQTQTTVLVKSLERTARESQYLEVYWTSLLPHGQAFPPQAARYSTTSWTGAIQDLYHKDPLVRIVLLANALTLTAQQIKHPPLMVQGGRLYSMALRLIAQSLLDTQRHNVSGVLAASGLLASYESLLNEDGRHSWLPAPTWLRHVSGELAIILAGGPESFVEGHAHQLFIDYRLHLIYPYLQARVRCPLSSLQWKTIPWSTYPKSPKDKLLDILIELPGILEDMATLESSPGQLEQLYPLYHALKERPWECDRQLMLWSTTCGEVSVAFVENLIAVPNLDVNREGSTPSSTDLAMAHLGIIYWTTYQLLSQILFALKDDGLSPRIDPYLYSRKIALLIPFFNKPGVGSYMISFIGFPVTVAASFLARQDSVDASSEARVLLAKAFRGERGKQLQRFLASWPWMTGSESDTLGMTGVQATLNES